MASYIGGFVGGDAVALRLFEDTQPSADGSVSNSNTALACAADEVDDLDPFRQRWGVEEPPNEQAK